MIFNSGWNKKEIEELTYRELFDLVELYYRQEQEKMFQFFKLFCISNAESSMVAFNGEESTFKNYMDQVRARTIEGCTEEKDSDDFESQFEE